MALIHQADHTDSVQRKVELLSAAHAAGRFDLAMSLAESIKDTLQYERQIAPLAERATLSHDTAMRVDALPPALARWARGWTFCTPLSLFETVGIARSSEPIDVNVSLPAEQLTDPAREMRVARLDANESVREIPSQVYDVRRTGSQLRFRLVLQADVAAHQPAHYLVFHGNPFAERPDYVTDLQARGEGYALDITNAHYRTILSAQTGQIERIVYAREHGLELYAGGKGHGEPPDIDWGHDYVDQGGFQKIRMRNAPHWPNFDVVRGPLCVQVRRFGFPYSPAYPLFTPSRVHMDITYTFYAGQPYFLKQGSMEAIQDLRIEAMRDDEWVFSGYSFTDPVWIDSAGRLHEGAPPASANDELWGVGFVNRVSRDAFIALRLEHTAKGLDHLSHGGVPSMHYAGHGQLWSRYPAQQTELRRGTIIQQKNAYLVAPYPAENAAARIEQTRHRLLNPLEVRAEMPPSLKSVPAGPGTLARFGETSETAPLKPAIWKALAEIKDEQFYTVDANAVDMGYIYDVRERSGRVYVLVTMPHRGRPVYQFLAAQGGGRISEGIRERLLRLPGVRDVVVDFTWNPPWTAARLTAAGREAMGLPTTA